MHPSGGLPLARNSHSMVRDSRTGTMILFGGSAVESPEEEAGPLDMVNDTWALDPATSTWTELHPAGGSPAPRYAHAMVYDERSGTVIMFGGVTSGGDVNDTWAYNPATNLWTELHPEGDVPSARSGHSMVYDSRSGSVILFGGDGIFVRGDGASTYRKLNDTWIYDPVTNVWTELAPAGYLPPGRSAHAMVYDPVAGKVILFGGVGGVRGGEGLSDTWAYGVDD